MTGRTAVMKIRWIIIIIIKKVQACALWYLEMKNFCHNWKITVLDDGVREWFECLSWSLHINQNISAAMLTGVCRMLFAILVTMAWNECWSEQVWLHSSKFGTTGLTNVVASHHFTSTNNFFSQQCQWRRRNLTHGALLKDTLITRAFSLQLCYLFVCLTFVL